MIRITFNQMFCFITVAWIIYRIIAYNTNKKSTLKHELHLILVYISIVIISRFVYFPLHYVDGHIGTLNFDKDRIFPFWMNLRPFTFVWERYDGWQTNIIGNIAMFIPVGITWPICYKKLNSFKKTVLAGAIYTILIEISQLPFYNRCSDIDDFILNTTGAVIGSLIYFTVSHILKKHT